MKKYLLIILAFLTLPSLVGAFSPYYPYQGGTGTSAIPAYGQVLVGTSGGLYTPMATSSLGITSGGGSSSDPFTHPLLGLSATTSQMLIGTSTANNNQLTVSSSTAPQLALSAGANLAQWTFRNAGGNLYFSTTTVAGTATTSTSAFSITNAGIPAFPALVSCAGLQTSATGVISCTSDARSKDIQSEYNRGLSAILGLQPENYSWKKGTPQYDNGVLYTGFIAQNVQKSIPEAINVGSDGKFQVSQTAILATAVNAIKDLNEKVDNLPQSPTAEKEFDWKWIAIGLLALGFVGQQYQIYKLKK